MSTVSTLLLNANLIPKTHSLEYFQKGFKEFLANEQEQKPIEASCNFMFWEMEDF